MKNVELRLGDNLEILKEYADNSIDAVITDPPYGIRFMNNKWDYQVPSVDFWMEIYRVIKPGGHILSFCGTRTYHRAAVNVEDAGFEIRDTISWLYATGMPKALDIGKKDPNWQGWRTSLKPAQELIVLARKPIGEKTITENVIKWRNGALNIDKCRIETDDKILIPNNPKPYSFSGNKSALDYRLNTEGRFPTNVILENGDVADLLNAQYKGASRFFFQAKVSNKERNMALDDFSKKEVVRQGLAGEKNNPYHSNYHPTIKPVNLLSYLVNLITSPGGTILDAFMGSGSTGIAALLNNFNFIGIEIDENYYEIAKERIKNYEKYRVFIK